MPFFMSHHSPGAQDRPVATPFQPGVPWSPSHHGAQATNATAYGWNVLPPRWSTGEVQSFICCNFVATTVCKGQERQAACPRHTPAPFVVESRRGPLPETPGDTRSEGHALPHVLLVSMRLHPAPAPTCCQCLNSQKPQRPRRSR